MTAQAARHSLETAPSSGAGRRTGRAPQAQSPSPRRGPKCAARSRRVVGQVREERVDVAEQRREVLNQPRQARHRIPAVEQRRRRHVRAAFPGPATLLGDPAGEELDEAALVDQRRLQEQRTTHGLRLVPRRNDRLREAVSPPSRRPSRAAKTSSTPRVPHRSAAGPSETLAAALRPRRPLRSRSSRIVTRLSRRASERGGEDLETSSPPNRGGAGHPSGQTTSSARCRAAGGRPSLGRSPAFRPPVRAVAKVVERALSSGPPGRSSGIAGPGGGEEVVARERRPDPIPRRGIAG